MASDFEDDLGDVLHNRLVDSELPDSTLDFHTRQLSDQLIRIVEIYIIEEQRKDLADE